ncbi:hypothetical protein JQ633_33555 [Bradyrhizobium tropiciagri]|uniref:hypothetical protein n=1 Tax=Bradyrhizobium tropiciagri TaxID=312253 RepID=UPI001BA79A39|nr:hypothetical protein [Bradyrhizobium tropiciagri]MBR0875325.1 hypothetical protein [Bradyrhizobium tropiciagri]
MKHATNRKYADPEQAARRLMEHARAFEPVQDGRIYIGSRPASVRGQSTPAEYCAGLKLSIERDWLAAHESGTYLRMKQAGRQRSF